LFSTKRELFEAEEFGESGETCGRRAVQRGVEKGGEEQQKERKMN